MILYPTLVCLLFIAVQGTSGLGVEELVPIAIVSLSSHTVRANSFPSSPLARIMNSPLNCPLHGSVGDDKRRDEVENLVP